MMLQHQRATFRARIRLRLIPGNEITGGIISAAIKEPAPTRPALNDAAAALWAFRPRLFKNRLRIPALGKTRAGQKLSVAPLLHYHHTAAQFARHIRNLYRHLHMADRLVRLFQGFFKWTVKIFQQAIFRKFPVGDLIQFGFHIRRKFHVDNIFKIFLQHIDDDKTQLRRMKLLIHANDITAGEDRFDDRRVGARPPNPLFFQRLDQRRLVVTRRRLREMLLRQYIHRIQDIARRHLRQYDILFLFPFRPVVNRRKSSKFQLRSARAELIARSGG